MQRAQMARSAHVEIKIVVRITFHLVLKALTCDADQEESFISQPGEQCLIVCYMSFSGIFVIRHSALISVSFSLPPIK